MKASTFIKTALIDQMQIIADAGLWFHLAKLIPSGVDVLARVRYGKAIRVVAAIELPHKTNIRLLYNEFLPKYVGKYPESTSFYSPPNSRLALFDDDECKENHLQEIDGVTLIHVPLWFADFKALCEIILAKIESGECQDIDVFKSVEP